MAGLRARAAFISQRISEIVDVSADESAEFVRRSLPKWEEFFAGKGVAHVLVYYQPRYKRTEEGEYIATDGPNRLHFTYGDDEPLKGRALYFIRTTDKPMDIDKVSSRLVMPQAIMPA